MSTYDVTVDMTLDVDVSMADSGYSIAADIGEVTVIGTVPQYTGSYVFTPTQSTQTIEIENKMATADITINPIPSNYGLITWDGATLTVS